jgi:ABC-type transport system involved in multi-copper enzyme maturation permease subunit
LGALGIFLVFNGLAMHSGYTKLGLGTCGNLYGPKCANQLDAFRADYQNWAQLAPRFFAFLPGVCGVFIGAPLVAREIETGTFRFAWTQGSNRVQWIVTKLVLLAVVICVLCLAFSALFAWWFGPWHSLVGRMESGQAYETEGIVFTARALFGFTLGALLGALIGRTVPAMAATAAVWLAVVWPSVIYLRPLIMKPITVSGNNVPNLPTAWGLDSWVQNSSGHHLTQYEMNQIFMQAHDDGANSPAAFNTWLAQHHYTNWTSYEPNSRFWHFQIVESSAYIVLTLLLAGATIWWLHRRAA